jgi:hypothetical protein
MAFQIILIVVATALVIVPQWFSSHTALRHSERLAELRNGAPERFFEERRSLETYRPKGYSWPYRLFGLVAMAFAIGSLVFRH